VRVTGSERQRIDSDLHRNRTLIHIVYNAGTADRLPHGWLSLVASGSRQKRYVADSLFSRPEAWTFYPAQAKTRLFSGKRLCYLSRESKAEQLS